MGWSPKVHDREKDQFGFFFIISNKEMIKEYFNQLKTWNSECCKISHIFFWGEQPHGSTMAATMGLSPALCTVILGETNLMFPATLAFLQNTWKCYWPRWMLILHAIWCRAFNYFNKNYEYKSYFNHHYFILGCWE